MVLLICVLLLFGGCGKSEDAAADTAPLPQAVIEETAAPEEPVPPAESTVSFGLDESVVCDDLCEMSGLYSEVLDDAAKAEGWYYHYTESDESPAVLIRWELSDGNYTTAEVLFTVKNISDRPQTFANRITAKMIYRENENSQEEFFDGTVFQQNPGQVTTDGVMIMWSTKPVAIAPGESANVSFRFDIPQNVYEKIYATAIGENTGIKETCEFSFGGGETYVIDLTQVLIPASQYEF